ncbi:MAG: hypothetical protein V7K47_12895 [Nostoc sp.]
MANLGNVQGAFETAGNFSNLNERISKLEEKNKELEQRISVLEKTKKPEPAAPSADAGLGNVGYSKSDVGF